MAQISGLTSVQSLNTTDLFMVNQGFVQGSNDGVEKKVDLDSLDSYFKFKKTLSFTLNSTDDIIVFDNAFSSSGHFHPTSPVFCLITISSGSYVKTIAETFEFIKTSESMPYVEFKDKQNYKEYAPFIYGYVYFKNTSISQISFESPCIKFSYITYPNISVVAYSMSDFTVNKETLYSQQGAGYMFGYSSIKSVRDVSSWSGKETRHAQIDINSSSLPSSTDEDTLYFIP